LVNVQKDDFSLKNYSRCLDLSLEYGYNFFTLSEFAKAEDFKKSIIMRHDIDTQLDVAVEISAIECERNISSTFFIRLHSHNYNVFCIRDLMKIKRIVENNHEIGLHYESDFYSIFNKDIKEEVEKEIEILEGLTGKKIKTICPHEPTRTNSFHVKNFNSNILQAYDDKLFKKFKYISDSSCRWRDGSFYENIISEKFDKLYILTHPYWWYNVSPIENY